MAKKSFFDSWFGISERVNAQVEALLPAKVEERVSAEIEKRSVGISNTAGMMQLLNIATEGGVPNVSDNTIETIPALVRAVDILCGACAKLPETIFDNSGKVGRPLPNHHIAQLLNGSPDGQLTSYVWKWNMWANRCLSGGGGAEIIRNTNGRPISLRLMRHGAQPYQTWPNDPIRYWDNETGKLYDAIDVIYLPGIMVRVGRDRFLPLAQAFKNTFGEQLAQTMLSMTLFKQGVYPAAVYGYTGTKGTLGGDVKLSDDISNYFGGLDRAGKVIPIPGMDKFQQLNKVSMVDSQAIDMRKWGKSEIALMFGLPDDMLGNTDKQSYAFSINTAKQFKEYTLDPKLTMWNQELTMKLMTDGEKTRRLCVETMVHENMWMLPSDRMDYFKKLFEMGAITPNEIRAYENMQPIEGGDEPYLQSQYIPVRLSEGFWTSQTKNTGSQPTEAQRSLEIEPPTGEKLNGHHVEN